LGNLTDTIIPDSFSEIDSRGRSPGFPVHVSLPAQQFVDSGIRGWQAYIPAWPEPGLQLRVQLRTLTEFPVRPVKEPPVYFKERLDYTNRGAKIKTRMYKNWETTEVSENTEICLAHRASFSPYNKAVKKYHGKFRAT